MFINCRVSATPSWACSETSVRRKVSSACEAKRITTSKFKRNELSWAFNRFVNLNGELDPYRLFPVLQQNLNQLRERTRFVEPAADDNDGYPSYLPKRAPVQGFFGMRGKKFGDYDLSGSDKRAPKGFMGMRGKKSGPDTFDDEDLDDQQPFDYNYNGIYEKRAPSGFTGVRGKKSLMFR